jgi:phosphoribosylamine---glycine ligase
MKVLIVGGGAREHALAWAFSSTAQQVFCAPGNAGTRAIATNVGADLGDVDSVVRAAAENAVDLVVVGPEAPLAIGVADALISARIPVFGPTRAAAQLEASKAFSKDFMREHDVPTADYAVFDDAERAIAYARSLGVPRVVKADGLAAGKGVVVATSVEETVDAIRSIMLAREHGAAGARIVLEEIIEGPEISYHVITDSERFVALPAAQDHKRLLENDRGPNTGGMGAYSPPPMLTPELDREVRERVIEPTLRGMRARGAPFSGVLFVGLMIVRGEPKVLEYNVRFGDPEATVLCARQPALPAMIAEVAGGRLDASPERERTEAPAAISVVMAAAGYPGTPVKGSPIEGLDAPGDAQIFHAGTTFDATGRVVTNGGRVLAVTARGRDLDEAAARAYASVARIRFEGAQYRKDIGWQARAAKS